MGAETREVDQGQASVNPGDQTLKNNAGQPDTELKQSGREYVCAMWRIK